MQNFYSFQILVRLNLTLTKPTGKLSTACSYKLMFKLYLIQYRTLNVIVLKSKGDTFFFNMLEGLGFFRIRIVFLVAMDFKRLSVFDYLNPNEEFLH